MTQDNLPLTYILQAQPHPSRRLCWEAIKSQPDGTVVKLSKPKRTSKKNALMWCVLRQMEQIDWYGEHLTDEEWKVVITAERKKQRAVPGISGGFVVLGEQTRNMPGWEIDEIIEIACALACEHGVEIQIKESAEPVGRMK